MLDDMMLTLVLVVSSLGAFVAYTAHLPVMIGVCGISALTAGYILGFRRGRDS